MSSRAVVTMVQTAQSHMRNHPTDRPRANSSASGFLAPPKMRSVAVIVGDVLGQKAPEMALVQGNDVVKQFTSATANPAFRESVVPRAPDAGLHSSNFHRITATRTSNPYFAS